MKRVTLLFALALAITVVFGLSTKTIAGTSSHFWSGTFGDANAQEPRSVCTDADGDVYVAGYFQGTVNFGGSDLTSAGQADIFLVKFSPSGSHVWSYRFGSSGDDQGLAVASDPFGNVYLAGSFAGTVDFGGGNLVANGGVDIFVAKFNASGSHLWSQRFGDSSLQTCYAVTADASGNVFITGSFSGSVDFGGGSLVCQGANDIFVAKFNSSGAHQWSARFGDGFNGVGKQVGNAIGTDGSGNVLIAGSFPSSANFGGSTLFSAGGDDIFVAKFDGAGVHQWSKRFGDANSQECYSLAVDATDAVCICGEYAGTVDFGGGPLVFGGFIDAYVAKLDASGNHVWSKHFGDSDFQRGLAVTTDASRNVYLTGSFAGSIDFGGGPIVASGFEAYLAKFTPNGQYQWSDHFSGSAAGYSLATVGASAVAMTGTFSGTIDLGAGSAAATGSTDMFVAEFGTYPAAPVIGSITDIPNDNGRQVRVTFDRTGYDGAFSPLTIDRYEIYRRVDPVPAALIPASDAGPRRIVASSQLWDYVASAPAHATDRYSVVVSTIADSTIVNGLYDSVFFVRAATLSPLDFIDSSPDSGYSLDNLAPIPPASLQYAAGVLTWQQSTDPSFDYFTVSGSNAPSFVSATMIGHTVAPAMDVSQSPRDYYFVTATDLSGNEGKPTMISLLTGVSGMPTFDFSVTAFPNPFNPGTTVHYEVPLRGRVTLGIYDARGSLVRTLIDSDVPAGGHAIQWDGRDKHGNAAASGIYVVHVVQEGASRSCKIVLLK
jgi:FlgD Ig-like domain